MSCPCLSELVRRAELIWSEVFGPTPSCRSLSSSQLCHHPWKYKRKYKPSVHVCQHMRRACLCCYGDMIRNEKSVVGRFGASKTCKAHNVKVADPLATYISPVRVDDLRPHSTVIRLRSCSYGFHIKTCAKHLQFLETIQGVAKR